MDEREILTNETTEETFQHPAWEVVPDPADDEVMEEVWEDAEAELKRGVAAVKEWLHSTLYEANRVFQEHKIAILAIIGAIATAAAAAGVLWAVLKKKK